MYASSNAALRYYAEGKPKVAVRAIEELLRLAGEEDPAAIAALTRQAEYVGKGLRLISASLAPEMILISGDIVGAWSLLGPVIEKSFAGSALADVRPRIMPTHEAETANLRGAAILVMQRRSSAAEGIKAKRPPQPTARKKLSPASIAPSSKR